ncbi:MAG: hypothetical protein HY703_01525 [Gemmatimonadetes bacterium]|nr:hypothetical protein [Gemmatimonadota bacterium]
MRLIPAFLSALLATLMLTPLVRVGARAAGVLARPSSDRWHHLPTALLGGIAICAGVSLGVAVSGIERSGPLLPLTLSPAGRIMAGIFAAGLIMFLAGAADDVFKLRPTSKLVFQGFAGSVLISFGVVYPLTPWAWANAVFTLFWFVALTNALNLLDNMDGVAAGIAALGALCFAGVFALEGAWPPAALAMAVAGAGIGFLPFNFRRASIFMGDSGSLFLGALLAGLGAACAGSTSIGGISYLLVPICILAIPIFDTTLVVFTRTLAGLSIFQGGLDHTTHRLVSLGLREPQVAAVLYVLAGVGGVIGLLMAQAAGGLGLGLAGVYLVALVALGFYLSRLHTYTLDEARASGRLLVLLSNVLSRGRALEVLLDLVVFAVAYYGAFLLRFDTVLPPAQTALFERTVAVAVAGKLMAFGLFGVYRGFWHQSSIPDLHRLVKATVVGALLTAAPVMLFFQGGEVSPAVFVIDGMLVVLLAAGARASFRWLDLVRISLDHAGSRTLIYGAGRTGELVLRELQGNPELGLKPIGFLDDDPGKAGCLVHGVPVLGTGRDLPQVAAQQRVQKLVIGTKKLDAQRMHSAHLLSRGTGVELLQMELDLRAVEVTERRRVESSVG